VTDRLLVSPGELFGDGVFETVHLRPAGPWLLDEHLDRLERSAAALDLPLPPRAELVRRVAAVPAAAREAALRIICTRQAVYVTVSPIPAETLRERREGVRVISAPRGRDVLAQAKTLSYAPNFAARRWARTQNADDVLWHTGDGHALEAPTASVVWLDGDELCTVPPAEAGILPGTTAARLLALAADAGLQPAIRMITLDELRTADAIWLTSALRGPAEVITLDGGSRPRSPWTTRLQSLLGF
jgi:4-amino-4-deoxychorismate lyase